MNKTRKELFLQGKLYSPIQGGRCHICFSSLWILLFYGYIYIYFFTFILFYPHLIAAWNKTQRRRVGDAWISYLTATEITAPWHHTAPCSPRISNANAAACLHVLSCILPANVQHFHNRSCPVLARSASKYDNSARWTHEESRMWERDRGWRQTLLTRLHLSIHHASVDLIPLHAIFCHYRWWYYGCLWCRVAFRGQNCTFLY